MSTLSSHEIRAGIAMFNDRRYHAAHDAWEEPWLGLSSGNDAERFLHGLIQYTAAIHHAHQGNRDGAVGLAESAIEYLAELPSTYAGVSLDPIRESLRALAVDPLVVCRRNFPAILHDGEPITLDNLEFEARIVVARVLAETESGWDEETIEQAIERAEVGEPENQFVALLSEFVCDDEHRGLIYRRMKQHLEREASKDADVDGLFGDR